MSASNLVQLQGGPAVTLAAVRLLWDLESRGFQIRTDADRLCVSPGSQLTAEDKAAITHHKSDLLRIVSYIDAGVQ